MTTLSRTECLSWAVEMIANVVGTPAEEGVAAELRKELVTTYRQDPADANGFVRILFAMVRGLPTTPGGGS